MSSSPTAPTSTTASSTSSPSEVVDPQPVDPQPVDLQPVDPQPVLVEDDVPVVEEAAQRRPGGHSLALIACGAIAQPAAQIVTRRGWPVDVHPLPPLLHNQPQRIAGEVRALAERLAPSYDRVVVGYADCGTYGALDAVCDELGLDRLPGLHCYDIYAGDDRIRTFFEEQPGTYLLTDFLVRSFARTVERELGLDRWPELRDAYFGHYTRVVWLAQEPDDAELRALADDAAARIGLPLTVVPTGNGGLERALADLVASAAG